MKIWSIFLSIWFSCALSAQAEEYFNFESFNTSFPMGYALVQVDIDGTQEKCIIDSGARISFVKNSAKFGSYAIHGTTVLTGVSGAEVSTDLITIPNLKIGSLNYSNVVVGRSDALPFPCIIGNDILKQQALGFSFATRAISNGVTNAQDFDLKSYSNLWFGFPIKVGDSTEFDSLWDTGASVTIIDIDFLDFINGKFEVLGESEIIDATGNKQKTKFIKIDKLQFGNLEVRNIIVMAANLSKLQNEAPTVKMILGYNVIRWMNWEMDYTNLRWSATKY